MELEHILRDFAQHIKHNKVMRFWRIEDWRLTNKVEVRFGEGYKALR